MALRHEDFINQRFIVANPRPDIVQEPKLLLDRVTDENRKKMILATTDFSKYPLVSSLPKIQGAIVKNYHEKFLACNF